MDEWQFYNRRRMTEIHDIEVSAYELAKASGDAVDSTSMFLSPALQAEKEHLIQTAFGDWNKPHFFLFVKLLARYGRSNLAAIAREMVKPYDEVARYADTFFTRGSELTDWDKIRKSIEKGESKLLEIQRLADQTALKIKRYANPYDDLVINYQGKGGKLFTEEEDRLLLCLVHTYGYGSWEKIKREIHAAPVCAFDYYLRSRSAAELGRRCDALMRICEKDNVDFDLKEKKDAALQRELADQRDELAKRIADAKAELNRNQALVDEKIMKEAKKMQAAREAKRQKKETKGDVDTAKVDDALPEPVREELRQMIAQSTDKEASTIALKFCAKHVKCHSRKRPLDDDESKDGAAAASSKDSPRLPKSPWSPSAMKQASSKKAKKQAELKKPPRKPRSAYVLFSLAKRNQVRASMPADTGIVDLMSRLTELWLDMSEADKAPWYEAQEIDKKRYDTELEEANP
ncbi:hypothetical protein DYB30_008198 [Aphanomyces astaci]|uniref:HMG box domain-containing protein n=1 Tax=Aphanomyces astaci TaxID=112090 RepID=A0A397D8K5_APHAT|nr:hypothetical protein DYB30_008198 [Aphanomyces astaci]